MRLSFILKTDLEDSNRLLLNHNSYDEYDLNSEAS